MEKSAYTTDLKILMFRTFYFVFWVTYSLLLKFCSLNFET